MRYTATVRRPDGSTFESRVDTTAGNTQATELAKTLAESYGAELASLVDAEGETIVGDSQTEKQIDKQDKDTEERVDEQDKTTTERVDDQSVDTKEARPNKTGDIQPNR